MWSGGSVTGLSILANYTFGKLMDDVGGADGQGGKTVQSFDSYKAAWGLSPLDRKHRFNLSYVYEFPFGKGRKWMGSPSGLAARIVDKVIGGWQVAGNYQFYTGTPITLTGSTTSNINNTIKINQTWGSYADRRSQPDAVELHDAAQMLLSPVNPITSRLSAVWIRPRSSERGSSCPATCRRTSTSIATPDISSGIWL